MAAGLLGPGDVPEIDVQQAREYIAQHAADDDFVLLDVRTSEEIEDAHIEGVLRLDILSGEFQRRLPLLDPQKDYLLVCRSGNRSGHAAAMMLNNGFRRAVNLKGGMLDWIRAGYPIEQGGVEQG